MKNNKSLNFKIIIFLSFFLNYIPILSQEIKLYLKNTGNEAISVAFGYHKKGWFNSSDKYYGWYKLEPGQTDYYLSIYSDSEASFVFAKRSGSIVYNIKNPANQKIGVDKIYVSPDGNGFKYEGNPPSSYVPIQTSFKIAQAYCYNCSGQTLHQTIEIPSYSTDKVVPLDKKKTQIKTSKIKDGYELGKAFGSLSNKKSNSSHSANISLAKKYKDYYFQNSVAKRITKISNDCYSIRDVKVKVQNNKSTYGSYWIFENEKLFTRINNLPIELTFKTNGIKFEDFLSAKDKLNDKWEFTTSIDFKFCISKIIDSKREDITYISMEIKPID